MVVGLTQLRGEDDGRKDVPCGLWEDKFRAPRSARHTWPDGCHCNQQKRKYDQIEDKMGDGQVCTETDQPGVLLPRGEDAWENKGKLSTPTRRVKWRTYIIEAKATRTTCTMLAMANPAWAPPRNLIPAVHDPFYQKRKRHRRNIRPHTYRLAGRNTRLRKQTKLLL